MVHGIPIAIASVGVQTIAEHDPGGSLVAVALVVAGAGATPATRGRTRMPVVMVALPHNPDQRQDVFACEAKRRHQPFLKRAA